MIDIIEYGIVHWREFVGTIGILGAAYRDVVKPEEQEALLCDHSKP